MHEADAWWGHLPVISKYESTIFPRYAEWHMRQLVAAIAEMRKRHADALRIIPQAGFHVRAIRRIEKHDRRNGYVHLMAVAICEDTDRPDLVKVAFANNTGRKGSFVENPDMFGSDENLLIPVFEELVVRIPDGWLRYGQKRIEQTELAKLAAEFQRILNEPL
jgi:hypothetical protein